MIWCVFVAFCRHFFTPKHTICFPLTRNRCSIITFYRHQTTVINRTAPDIDVHAVFTQLHDEAGLLELHPAQLRGLANQFESVSAIAQQDTQMGLVARQATGQLKVQAKLLMQQATRLMDLAQKLESVGGAV